MKRLALFLLLLASPAFAQSVTLPDEVRGESGAWIIVAPLKVDGGSLKWRIDPKLQEVRLDLLLPPEMLAKLKGKVVTGPPGRYRIESWCAKGDVASDIATCWVQIGGVGPIPPPDPKPDPGPDPIPVLSKLWIVIIEETAEATATRGQWFTDKGLKSRIDLKGHRLVIADKDARDRHGNVTADLAPWIKRAKTLPHVFFILPDGSLSYSGPLPKTPAELTARIAEKGG